MSDSPSVTAILKRAGGPKAIALASCGAVKESAVHKWGRSGIPDRHWPVVMKLSGASADELLAANVAVRQELL